MHFKARWPRVKYPRTLLPHSADHGSMAGNQSDADAGFIFPHVTADFRVNPKLPFLSHLGACADSSAIHAEHPLHILQGMEVVATLHFIYKHISDSTDVRRLIVGKNLTPMKCRILLTGGFIDGLVFGDKRGDVDLTARGSQGRWMKNDQQGKDVVVYAL